MALASPVSALPMRVWLRSPLEPAASSNTSFESSAREPGQTSGLLFPRPAQTPIG
jgi:hypothetical protein